MGISSNLLASMYKGWPVINREATGFLSALNINSDVAGLSIHDKIKVFRGGPSETEEYEQNFSGPSDKDPTMAFVEVELEKAIKKRFTYTGEEELALVNSATKQTALDKLFEANFRSFNNEIEKYVADKVVAGASRAYGTAGTTPFATANDLSDFAQVNLILDDNGCPSSDRQLVLSNVALANLRGKMSNLFKVNEAGTEQFLREGYAGNIQGLYIRSSAGLKTHEKGAGASYVVDTAAAVNDTDITVKTGSGAIKAGDVITLNGDTNKYVVNEGITAAGTLKIGRNGLQKAAAANAAVTVGNNYTPNVAFNKDSIAFAARPPKIPESGDAALWHEVVTDPYTGISYLVSCYPGHGKNEIEIAIVIGCKVVESANVALLLG